MNALFVNVKVDREERPDLDAIYQHALALIGEQGGWPLTMFLTPDGEPFWGGTYFPPAPRYGRPGFPQVLETSPGFPRRTGTPSRERRGDPRWPRPPLPRARRRRYRPQRTRRCRPRPPRHDRYRARRSARRPEIPANAHLRGVMARLAAHRRHRIRPGRHRDLRPHVPGRNLRPSRRRLRPLFHRSAMAGPAFREDALRQRAAPRPSSPSCGRGRRRSSSRPHPRDRGLVAARDGRRVGRLRRHPRRRQRGRGGPLLRLERRRGGGRARRRRAPLQGRLRRLRRRQLGRPATSSTACACRRSTPTPTKRVSPGCAASCGSAARSARGPRATTRSSPTGTASRSTLSPAPAATLGEPGWTEAARRAFDAVTGTMSDGRPSLPQLARRPGAPCGGCSKTTPTWPAPRSRFMKPTGSRASSTSPAAGSPCSTNASAMTPRRLLPVRRRRRRRHRPRHFGADGATPPGNAVMLGVLATLAAVNGARTPGAAAPMTSSPPSAPKSRAIQRPPALS